MILNIDKILEKNYSDILEKIQAILPKIGVAIIIIILGFIFARFVYLFVIYLFKKFKLMDLIDKIQIEFEESEEGDKKFDIKKDIPDEYKFSHKIKADKLVAKSISYYLFIISFRSSISYIGIVDVENFLSDLIAYLPNLFVGILIGFFGIRFANSVYEIVYHTLNLAKQNTASIIATGAKIVILFFTFMLVLSYIKIVDTFIINTIFIGFISMVAISGGLAFGLGGRKIAKEILESFKK